MRESEVEAYLVKRVQEIGGEVRKVKWIGRDGAPDRCVMLPDRAHCGVPARTTYWAELKAAGKAAKFPGNAHERKQAREHARMRKCGQAVVVLDTPAAIDAFLEAVA